VVKHSILVRLLAIIVAKQCSGGQQISLTNFWMLGLDSESKGNYVSSLLNQGGYLNWIYCVFSRAVLLGWHCNALCISGFEDDVTFPHNGRYGFIYLFGIWEITAQCDAWYPALYKYSYLLTYLRCAVNLPQPDAITAEILKPNCTQRIELSKV